MILDTSDDARDAFPQLKLLAGLVSAMICWVTRKDLCHEAGGLEAD